MTKISKIRLAKFIFAISIFLFTKSVFACMELPEKKTVSGTSFQDEVFSFVTLKHGPQITNGSSTVFYSPIKQKWCYFEISSPSEVLCFENGDTMDITAASNQNKVVGKGQIVGNVLVILSVDSKGKIDSKKPYARFAADFSATKSVSPDGVPATEYQTTLTLERYNQFKKKDGEFVYTGYSGVYDDKEQFVRSGPSPRGISIEKEADKSLMSIAGVSQTKKGGCGGDRTSTTYSEKVAPAGSNVLPLIEVRK